MLSCQQAANAAAFANSITGFFIARFGPSLVGDDASCETISWASLRPRSRLPGQDRASAGHGDAEDCRSLTMVRRNRVCSGLSKAPCGHCETRNVLCSR